MKLQKTYRWIVLIVFGIGILLYIASFSLQPENVKRKLVVDNHKIPNITKYYHGKQEEEKKKIKKIILFTKSWWNDGKASFPYLKEANHQCPTCLFTEDANLNEISDAILFHGVFLNQIKLPERRTPNQKWIFVMFETPELHSYIPPVYDDVFNWTMTYRNDSDIFTPYGSFILNSEIQRPSMNQTWAFIQGRNGNSTYQNYDYQILPSLEGFGNRRTASWIVSRCISSSQREKIASQLSTHLQLDIYGDCGRNKCKINKAQALTGVDCRIQIHKKYKFYLAFENSLCTDYVTEKFFDILLTEMIPIVYGKTDYAALFPPKSFINVKDFKSVKELANYLNYLAKHPLEWLKYFEWRDKYWVSTNRFVLGYCKLCHKLWDNNGKDIKEYQSISNWWKYGNSSKYLGNSSSSSSSVCTKGSSIINPTF